MHKLALLEGLLFIVGEEGLTLEKLSQWLSISKEEAKSLLTELKQIYKEDKRGITIHFLGNTFKLTTKQEHKDYYQQVLTNTSPYTLSQSALETLAIIAYNEPITRISIDRIRGVNSSQMVRKLVAQGFIKEVGRSDLPGRPILYKITNDFLDYFGLANKEELPNIKTELNEEDNEIDLFQSNYKEE